MVIVFVIFDGIFLFKDKRNFSVILAVEDENLLVYARI